MRKRRRSALVPRSVIGARFCAVVPTFVLLGIEACSSGGPVVGVAAVAYCCFEAGVADAAFLQDGDAQSGDSDAPSDAPSDGDAPSDAPEGG